MIWIDLELINGWKAVDHFNHPQYRIDEYGVEFRGHAVDGEGAITRLPESVFDVTGSGQITYTDPKGNFTVTIDENRYLYIEYIEDGNGRN